IEKRRGAALQLKDLRGEHRRHCQEKRDTEPEFDQTRHFPSCYWLVLACSFFSTFKSLNFSTTLLGGISVWSSEISMIRLRCGNIGNPGASCFFLPKLMTVS